MPATVQPVIVTPSIPLLLAFYKALLGAVEISRVPEPHAGRLIDGVSSRDHSMRSLCATEESHTLLSPIWGYFRHITSVKNPDSSMSRSPEMS